MDVTIQVFAALKEAVGTSVLHLEVEPDSTVSDVLSAFVDACPVAKPYRSVMRPAVAGAYVADDRTVEAGDEVAIITPVSGG